MFVQNHLNERLVLEDNSTFFATEVALFRDGGSQKSGLDSGRKSALKLGSIRSMLVR